MKKKLIGMGIILGLCFCSACGNNAEEAQETVVEEKAEAEEKEAGETATEEQEKEAQTEEASKEEQSDAEDIKLAMKEGQYDKAIEMLNSARSEMEADEYAILLSNAYLYKGDYVAAADVLVEEIKKTGSDTLKARLEYIRENTVMVESKSYSYDTDGNLSFSITCEYDTDEKEIKKHVVYGEEEDGNYSYTVESEYDDKGNIIKQVTDNRYEDGNTEITEEITENEYYQDGTLKKKRIHHNGGVISKESSEEEYDSNGNKILENHYTDGELVCYYKWEYDADGNEMRQEFRRVSEEESSFENYAYEYDDAGNVVKKTGSDEEGNVTLIEEYDSNGNRVKYQFGNDFRSETEFNSLNDVISGKFIAISDFFSDGTDTAEYVYQFIGNIE